MKTHTLRIQRLTLPGATLLALLQRLPALPFAAEAEAALVSSPLGQVLRSVFAAAAALEAIQSVAGATPLAPSQGTETGTSVTVGSPVNIAYTVLGTQTPPLSWRIGGSVPPGLSFSGRTTPGLVDVTTLTLTGTPTTAGTFDVTLSAFEGAGGTLVESPMYPYQIVVNAAGGGGGGGGGGGPVPAFTLQPTSQTIATGDTVVFTTNATGATAYRWQKNGADVAGAADVRLLIRGATAADAGTYTAIATNSSGSVTSGAATLTVAAVAPGDAGRLTNISVRTGSGAGDQILNVGFSIGGAGASGGKPLLVRVSGPALAGFGVTGTINDPTLAIQPLGSTTVVASNDNWSGSTSVSSAAASVAAFPWTNSSSLDAAVVTTLNPGVYTALAGGKGTDTGIVLTEIYDTTPTASITATTPRLVNVSARAQVNAGGGVLIAGFVVGGTTSKTLLIRATGPALAQFGVGGTLVDPKLEVWTLSGLKLYENDNWGGAASLAQVVDSVGAFAISNAASKDAALLVTLPPGAYTAVVSGANDGTGVALVELYEVK